MLECELRSILSDLIAPPADIINLDDELRSMLRRLAEAKGCLTELKLGPSVAQGLPNAVNFVLLRIAQEALSNIARHAAGARRVHIELKRTARYLSLIVEDDGSPELPCTLSPPFRSRTRSGYGLRNMRERLLSVDGALRTKRLPDRGFRITARIPLGLRPS